MFHISAKKLPHSYNCIIVHCTDDYNFLNQLSLSGYLGSLPTFCYYKKSRSKEYLVYMIISHMCKYICRINFWKWNCFGQRICVFVMVVPTAKLPSKRDCTLPTLTGKTRRCLIPCQAVSETCLFSPLCFQEYLETQTSCCGSSIVSGFTLLIKYLSTLCFVLSMK